MKTTKLLRAGRTVLLAGLLVFAAACTNGIGEGEDTAQELPASALGSNLASKAGQRSYWKHAGQTKASAPAATTRAGENGVSYPFETISVRNIAHYMAKPFNAGPFHGISELFVTAFTTDEDGPYSISSILLTIKHEAGEYSCIANSGMSHEGTEETEFSSHIQLTENAIEKSLDLPIYSFRIRSTPGKGLSFGYSALLSFDGAEDAEAWFPLAGGNEVTANDSYHVTELID